MFAETSGATGRIDWRIPAAWLTLCIVWSSTWLAIKVGLRDLPPISYVGIRFLIAIIALVAVSVGQARLLPQRRSDYVVLAFTGILMFTINYVLLFWGELHVSSGLAAILQASIPIFGMVFAHWLLPEEPLRWQRLLGSFVSIGGVALICVRLLSFNGWFAFLGGLGITFGAASAAFSNVLLKTRRMDLAPAMMGGLANDFRNGTVAGYRMDCRWQSSPFSLDRDGNFLPALSRDHRILAHLFASLLADATDVGNEIQNHLADHSARRDRDWLGSRRGTIVSLVAPWCLFRSRRCVDDISATGGRKKKGRGGAGGRVADAPPHTDHIAR